MINLEGKVAIVTGSTKGIGKAIALELARAGADVVVTYNADESKGMETMEEVKKIGRKVALYQFAVQSMDSAKELVRTTIKEMGGIDILVNNVGITHDSTFFMMSSKEWKEVMEINLDGVYNTCKAVIGQMISKRSGNIINVTSVSGFKGIAGQTNYSASKAGIIGFTKSLAHEVARYGITVNGVAPGFIETEMTEDFGQERKEKYLANIPLNRFGKPEDVAKLVTFLASDYCSYILGEIITIDGGLTA